MRQIYNVILLIGLVKVSIMEVSTATKTMKTKVKKLIVQMKSPMLKVMYVYLFSFMISYIFDTTCM